MGTWHRCGHAAIPGGSGAEVSPLTYSKRTATIKGGAVLDTQDRS